MVENIPERTAIPASASAPASIPRGASARGTAPTPTARTFSARSAAVFARSDHEQTPIIASLYRPRRVPLHCRGDHGTERPDLARRVVPAPALLGEGARPARPRAEGARGVRVDRRG